MLARVAAKLSYANVVATLALFIAIGGASYAAVNLPANSVGTRQLKNAAVTPAKVASSTVRMFKGQSGPRGVTGPKGDPGTDATINGVAAGGDLSGTYPNPTLAASESWHDVGADGQPAFSGNCDGGSNIWANTNANAFPPAAFYRDRFGTVHLQGLVKCAGTSGGNGMIFELPPGYRPALEEDFPAATVGSDTFNDIEINTSGSVYPLLGTASANNSLSLAGITFRCAPSGVNGCP